MEMIVCRFCNTPKDAKDGYYNDTYRRLKHCHDCYREYQKKLARQSKAFYKDRAERKAKGTKYCSDFSSVQKLEDIAYANAKAGKYPLFDVSRMITETMEILNSQI